MWVWVKKLATIYHQLGIVAQELREYGEAKQNY